jgi:hypothetical protein
VPKPPELARPAAPPENRGGGARALPHPAGPCLKGSTPYLDARAAPKTMMRLLATATAATALLFSPTPGVLVLSPALTGPRTTFSVGPHAGESYERVWREDPQFCVWALEQPAPRAELEDFQTWLRSVWKSTSVSGAPDNSPRSHFLTMTRPCWLRRAVRDPHRHAIEQASRRWRGGRRVVKI